MLYYIALYIVRKWFSTKPIIPFVAASLLVLIWYYFEDSSTLFMYGRTYFKWIHYFLFMLTGAYVGGNVWQLKSKPKWDVLLLVISIVLFYGIQFMAGKSEFFAHLQILSLLPLMGIVVYTYKLCCWDKAKNMMMSKGGVILRFIAGLCLEAYLVQYVIIAQVNGILTSIIPINIILTFILIIIAAYIVRCFARIFSQLFEKEDFDWKAVVRLVD